MILIDANLLLYAVNAAAPQHNAARRWLDGTLSGTEEVGFAWPVILAFLRIATHPGLFPRPLSAKTATAKLDAWLAQPVARVLDPSTEHWSRLAALLRQTQCTGNLIQDAHLAALAIECGATLCSTDADFSRFPALKWLNPLADQGDAA
ncbi:MAG TPA: type II toxin-antitoxin system VapC family toxin [Verrucomicrobiota bacterium]|nr:type II toxin-antitoxin system VapC family toxin [Verrucomicrobiota bacterium]HNU49983.1 type II toxin-antitoxin system VapC family toxin [Verrucomicrobiota bacterium]